MIVCCHLRLKVQLLGGTNRFPPQTNFSAVFAMYRGANGAPKAKVWQNRENWKTSVGLLKHSKLLVGLWFGWGWFVFV